MTSALSWSKSLVSEVRPSFFASLEQPAPQEAQTEPSTGSESGCSCGPVSSVAQQENE